MRRIALALALAACGGGQAAAPAPIPAPPETAPAPAPTVAAPVEAPKLRLPAGIKPTRYALDLTLRPEADSFGGTVTIELAVAAPAPVLWLNAVDLTVDEAHFVVGGEQRPAKVVGSAPGFVGLAAAAPLPAGPASVVIAYRGKVSDSALVGFFRVKEADRWYLLSKFESIFARRAFPGFDEPGFKTPFALTLHVAKELTARSNTPVSGETDEPGGMKTVTFAETKPLPTYLFALCVGPWDVVETGKFGASQTPIAFIVPAGRGPQTAFAASAAGNTFALLEAYFGVPYPYGKLDLIAAPQYPGAMENAGLVLYAARLLLIDPERGSLSQKRSSALVIAHETAHMWFGDLVTTAWWDDIWLNEGFATWLEAKIVDQWQPAWQVGVDKADLRARAMGADALAAARQVRQPIAAEDDIFNSFDAITYDKGASVLAMFEAWLGAEPFQRGVHRYLEAHAHGNATSKDFLAALSEAAGRDVSARFSTFLDQPGVPEVSLSCDKGNVRLSQRRYGALGSPPGAGRWSFPVCLRAAGLPEPKCVDLEAEEGTLSLGATCPTWILGNAGGLGYYQTLYQGDLLGRLAKALPSLTLRERYTLVRDLAEQVLAGRTPVDQALALLPVFAADPEPRVVGAAVGMANAVEGRLVDPAERKAWAALVRKVFGARAHKLGWAPKDKEDDATRALRGPLVSLVATDGQDAALAAAGVALARRWLTDRTAADPDVRGAALDVLVRGGDAALLAQLVEAVKTSKDAEERNLLLRTLGHFRDPAVLARVMDLLLSPDLNARDGLQVFFSLLGGDRDSAALKSAFFRQHLEELVPRYPPNFTGNLITIHGQLCDRAAKPELEAFFKDRAAKVPGGPRALRQMLESMDVCVAVREAQRPALLRALARSR